MTEPLYCGGHDCVEMAEENEDALMALLNGIARLQFFGEHDDVTYDVLKEQFYPKLSANEFQQLVERMSPLLRSIASSNMDFNQLEAYLTSQVMRKTGLKISENEANVLKKFWTKHKTKIHEALIKSSTFNPTLDEFHWRVDVPTQTKSANVTNAPVTIVEMKLKHNTSQKKEPSETIHFELDNQGLNKLLQTLNEIDVQLNAFGKS